MIFNKESLAAVDFDRSIFVRGDLTALEVLDFVSAWKGIAALQACRTVKPGVFELTFRTKEFADLFEDLGFSFSINGKNTDQRPANNLRKKISISGLPGSFKEHILRKYLSELGTLESLTQVPFPDAYCEVSTGVWTAVLSSRDDPPPTIRMGDFTARLSFPGQRRTCWDCLAQHPRTEKCQGPKCRSCFRFGHLAASCPAVEDRCNNADADSCSCNLHKFLRIVAGESSSSHATSPRPALGPTSPAPPAGRLAAQDDIICTTPQRNRKKKTGKGKGRSRPPPTHPAAAPPAPFDDAAQCQADIVDFLNLQFADDSADAPLAMDLSDTPAPPPTPEAPRAAPFAPPPLPAFPLSEEMARKRAEIIKAILKLNENQFGRTPGTTSHKYGHHLMNDLWHLDNNLTNSKCNRPGCTSITCHPTTSHVTI